MKRLIFIFILSFGLFSCKTNSSDQKNESGTDSGKKAKFEFTEDVHDFGDIVEGEKVSCSFKFKNVGEADLIISNAKASCGCTAPTYTKEPIAPGEEGKIDVTFDSSNKSGNQYKKITITANSDPEIQELVVTCNILKK